MTVTLGPEALGQRLAFEELVLAVSATLVGAGPEDLDRAVTAALGQLARFIGPGRAYVFQFSEDGKRFTATHEFCAGGAPSALEHFRDVPTSALSWGMDRLQLGQAVIAPSPEALPPEAADVAAAMRRLDIASFITVPLRASGRTLGGIGFDWFRVPGRWHPDAVRLLQLSGEVLAGVLGRARAERELRLLDERMSSFIASNVEAVFCYELDEPLPEQVAPNELFERFLEARLVVCNEAYARPRGGAQPQQLYGRRMRELAQAPRERLRELFDILVTRGNEPDGAEVRQNLPDGTVRWARARAHLVRSDGRVVRMWGSLRDVTALKKAEETRQALEAQLRDAQKLESLGLLAGGIAHDFNNLLLVITNTAEMARRDLTRDPGAAGAALQQVLDAAARAADLTRGLLTFARRQPLKRAPLDLNAVIRDLLGMLRRLIRASIELDFVPGHALGTVEGDRGQLEQVVVNLCVNAADAIGEQGRITVETENVKLNGAYVAAHPWARPGRYVLLSVSDTGAGMPPDVRERLFEPFFTTKELGRGTGLGLAVVYGIVQQHEGMIHVYSEPGQGTAFKIYLPIVERQASTVGRKVEGPVRGGRETLLVAEDHDLVRETVRRILDGAGYRVLLARDGAEALRLFEQHADELHLVLLDAVMPGVSGHAVYQQIAARRPSLPILIASGYTSGVFPEGFFARTGVHFLPKPYDTDHLLRRVRAALDEAERR